MIKWTTSSIVLLAWALGGCAMSRTNAWWESHVYDHVQPGPSINYVKLSEAGYRIEKPFPKIYFVDGDVTANRLFREFVTVMPAADEDKIANVAANYCSQAPALQEDTDLQQELEVHQKYHQQGLMLTSKTKEKAATTCFISAPLHCKFFHDIREIDYSSDLIKNDATLDELEKDMECDK